MADDPAGVRQEIVEFLEKDGQDRPRPTDRVRLHGVLTAACRLMGDLDDSLQSLARGLRCGGTPAARSELLVIGASVHLARGDANAARECVSTALELVGGELSRPLGRSHSARQRRQWLLDLKASCLLTRGEMTLRYDDRSVQEALRDSLEALALTADSTRLSVRVAAIGCLSATLLRFGTFRDVLQTLELIDQADRKLARRRIRRSHLFRVLLRWARALALARLGSVDRAENIMLDVIEHLRQKGQAERLRHAVDALAWIVEERAGRPDRAAYLRRKYAR